MISHWGTRNADLFLAEWTPTRSGFNEPNSLGHPNWTDFLMLMSTVFVTLPAYTSPPFYVSLILFRLQHANSLLKHMVKSHHGDRRISPIDPARKKTAPLPKSLELEVESLASSEDD